MRKILSLILCFVLVVALLAGCSKTADNTGSDAQQNSQQDTSKTNDQGGSKEDTKDKKDEVIVLKAFCPEPGTPLNWDSPVGKKLIEKTGVKIDVEFAVGDADQRLALMAASGEYPDIIPTKKNKILYDAGAFIPLDDLIDQYGPNIKKMYGDNLGRARWSLNDPHIYTIFWNWMNANAFTPTGSPFALQHEVVKELGYPELKTVKDYENAIRTYMERHPEIDGQPTIGFSLCADAVQFIISVTNPALFTTGAPNDGEWYIDPETYKPQFHVTRPEAKEYFRWLNHMNAEGLLDEESFVQKRDQYVAKIASGRVLATVNGTWAYQDAMKVLRSEGKEWRMYGIYPIALEGYRNSNNWKNYGKNLTEGYGISKNCKYPEEYIKFVDYYVSEEGQILVQWGLEGTHYTVKNGKREFLPEVRKQMEEDPDFGEKTGIGILSNILPRHGEGAKDSTGNYFRPVFPENIIAGYTEVEKQVLSKYGAKLWNDLFWNDYKIQNKCSVGNNPFNPDSNANVLYKKCQEIIQKYIPKAILAKPQEFDTIWDEFLMELEKANVKELYKQYEEEMHKRWKLWGYE